MYAQRRADAGSQDVGEGDPEVAQHVLEFTEDHRGGAPDHVPLDILRQGSASVQDTARQVGFDDPFHFSRVFKRFKGISPSAVRG